MMLLEEIKQATGGLTACAELLIANAIRRDRKRFAVGSESRILLWVHSNPNRRAGYGLIGKETAMLEATARYALKRLLETGAIVRSDRHAGSQKGFSYTMKETQ